MSREEFRIINTHNMKTLCITLLMLCGMILHAQRTYLIIRPGEDISEQIMYPPGTPFELRNANNDLISTNENYDGVFKITKPYTLTVFPTYKDGSDVFELTEGSIEVALTRDFFHKTKSTQKEVRSFSNGVTVSKTITPSETVSGEKNLILEFSNGIVFRYTDGNAIATLDNETLKIKNKYLIYSDLGVAKVSFNPRNGVLWWIFEPK